MSSRNARLAEADRAVAPALYEALLAMQEAALAGETSALRLAIAGAVLIRRVPAFSIDYLNVVDPETLKPLETLGPGARAIVAATIGGVRLIDNIELIPGANA
jgi:pantoate--beta-alanine ligase